MQQPAPVPNPELTPHPEPHTKENTMAILDLQDMDMPKTVARGSSRSKHSCGGGGVSGLSLLLC